MSTDSQRQNRCRAADVVELWTFGIEPACPQTFQPNPAGAARVHEGPTLYKQPPNLFVSTSRGLAFRWHGTDWLGKRKDSRTP
jgi:hypothetical protein